MPTNDNPPADNSITNEEIDELDDDFNEPLGERQPEVNDVIVCEGGCE